MTPDQQASVVNRIYEALKNAGIPMYGVSWKEPVPVVFYHPEATQAQKDQGDSIAASLTSPRRKRTMTSLLAAINALSSQDRQRLINEVQRRLVVEYLWEHPQFPRRLDPPILLDGDEPNV